MSTKQSVSKRLKAVLSDLSNSGLHERLHDGAKGFASDLKEMFPMYRPSDELDLDDPVVHGYIASAALSIAAGGPTNPLVEKAFEEANLDPKNPLSWRMLIDSFCWAYFGTKKKRGAPKKSDARRYCQLLRDFDRKKSSKPGLSDTRVCELLGKEREYRKKNGQPLTGDTLMDVLKKARNPEFNSALKDNVDAAVKGAKTFLERYGLATPAHEAEFREKLIAANRRLIARSWRREIKPPK